jgi:hypothetical protein
MGRSLKKGAETFHILPLKGRLTRKEMLENNTLTCKCYWGGGGEEEEEEEEEETRYVLFENCCSYFST